MLTQLPVLEGFDETRRLVELARYGSVLHVRPGFPVLSDEPLEQSLVIVTSGAFEVLGDVTLEERPLEGKKNKKKKLKVTVEEAKDLAGDSRFDNLDPYCIVKLGDKGKIFKTPTLNNAGKHPVWHHTGVLLWTGEPELEFSVYDYDTFGSDDICGTGKLLIDDMSKRGFDGTIQLYRKQKTGFI